MKLVVQRVAWAPVEVDGQVLGCIERGLLVYVGVAGVCEDYSWHPVTCFASDG